MSYRERKLYEYYEKEIERLKERNKALNDISGVSIEGLRAYSQMLRDLYTDLYFEASEVKKHDGENATYKKIQNTMGHVRRAIFELEEPEYYE